jgi:site-specific DNA-methyltransferase (adenine-specific)
MWIDGQGFPKSLNLGEGLGTALKPAHEPIVLARKPFKGTVAANVERYATGALHIDACRIGFASEDDKAAAAAASQRTSHNGLGGTPTFARTGDIRESINGYVERMDAGRWPANVLLDEQAAMVLDEMSGELTSGLMSAGTPRSGDDGGRVAFGAFAGTDTTRPTYADSGGASRFFYVAKPSREERDMGCEGLRLRSAGELTGRKEGSAGQKHGRSGTDRVARNHHPTVKPIELMRWLVRLVTPPGGVVLDPFMGSGTTGCACVYEQRRFIGIEREADYIEIARRRIAAVAPLFTQDAEPAKPEQPPPSGNLDLLESA